MRLWRKLESSIITSDRLARVSDSAKWLFTLLIVAQDDEGKYPWTKPRIQALTGTTDWNSDVCESLLSELRERGIATLQDGYVYLTNGAEKNGIPSNSKNYPLLYPVLSELGTETLPSRERVVPDRNSEIRVEKSRDKSREENPPIPPFTKKGEPPTLTIEETNNLIAAFGIYWPENEVRERIDEALNHTAVLKAKKPYLYVRGWLRRDAEKLMGRSNNGISRQNAQTNTQPLYVDPSTRPPSSTRFADLAKHHAANRDALGAASASEQP